MICWKNMITTLWANIDPEEINHALLGLPGTKLFSILRLFTLIHHQALMQCSVYLDSHPEWKQISLSNTAVAAEKVHKEQDKTQAALQVRRLRNSMVWKYWRCPSTTTDLTPLVSLLSPTGKCMQRMQRRS